MFGYRACRATKFPVRWEEVQSCVAFLRGVAHQDAAVCISSPRADLMLVRQGEGKRHTLARRRADLKLPVEQARPLADVPQPLSLSVNR